VAKDSHASYGNTLKPGITFPFPEPCDGGWEKDYTDFQIEYIDDPDPSWPEEKFGTIDAPWARERWYNPVDMLEDAKKVNQNYIIMQESQSKLYLHLYDAQDRHVGKNYTTNETETGIPGSFYGDFGNTTVIGVPANLTQFQLTVDATYSDEEVEEYNITIRTARNSEIKDEKSTNGTIEKGTPRYLYPKIDEQGNIIVIPEFPSFFILPLFFAVTLLVAIVYRRKRVQRE
jgi:hypothetical protein